MTVSHLRPRSLAESLDIVEQHERRAAIVASTASATNTTIRRLGAARLQGEAQLVDRRGGLAVAQIHLDRDPLPLFQGKLQAVNVVEVRPRRGARGPRGDPNVAVFVRRSGQ